MVNMPFHGHHHGASSQQNVSQNAPAGTAGGIYQAAQALGSIGAPTGDLRVATSGTTAAGTDQLYPSSGNVPGATGAGHTAPPSSSGLPGPGTSNPLSSPNPSTDRQTRQFETPRRTQTFNRQPDELHMSPMGQHGSAQLTVQGQQHAYPSSQAYSGQAPSINLQQASPQGAQFVDSSSSGNIPGALQAGNPGRPGPYSANTAPVVPTITTQSQQYASTPQRTATLNHSHNYSRSSPAGLDNQKYPETPDARYGSQSGQRYIPSQTPHATSNSPLGLEDIRPRAELGTTDGPLMGAPFLGGPMYPTTSNYLAPWAVYAFDWCKWPVQPQGGGRGAGKVALGSYLEDGHNFIQILDTEIVPSESATGPPNALEFTKLAEASHTYPVTRLLWEPPSSQKQSTDLLATSGDHLRLWSLPSQPNQSNMSNSITRSSTQREQHTQKLTPLALLSNSKSPEHTAPLTSLDWNTLSPSLIITSSIDTTCTIWDIPTLTAKTQLIAHDKEVFDVRFCANSVDVFVSCGADGSVRMFDLRSLEHSTIIYEPSEKIEKLASPSGSSPSTSQQTIAAAPPLLRLAASPHDAHLLATFSQDSSLIRILDVRQPGQALLELRGHSAPINCIEWSPSRRGTLASGADDCLVLIWDLLNQSTAAPAAGSNGAHPGQTGSTTDNSRTPMASWRCEWEVNNLSWTPQSRMGSGHSTDWLGIAGGRGVWGVNMNYDQDNV